MSAYEITVLGLVQGIGYRSFVAQYAHENGINGYVRNHGGTVNIIVLPEDMLKILSLSLSGMLKQRRRLQRSAKMVIHLMSSVKSMEHVMRKIVVHLPPVRLVRKRKKKPKNRQRPLVNLKTR